LARTITTNQGAAITTTIMTTMGMSIMGTTTTDMIMGKGTLKRPRKLLSGVRRLPFAIVG
jgi:hypothetical protein